MPRLLLMTIDFPPRTGGVARYLDALAYYFRQHIIVVAPPMMGASRVDQRAPYHIFRRPLLSSKFWPRWIDAILELVKMKSKYDIVITSHVLPIGLAAQIAKFFTGKPYVVIVHGLDVALVKKTARKRWLAGRVLRGAKLVVTNSYALKEEVEQDFGVKKSIVVYPTVSTLSDLEESVPSTSVWRQARGSGDSVDRSSTGSGDSVHKSDALTPERTSRRVEEGTIRLLTVSRLVERKGHLRVLAALKKLKDQGRIGGMEYTIVGDGPMESKIRSMVKTFGLEDVVRMRSGVDDQELAQIYAKSDIFVMPTFVVDDVDREGFGIVYLEAAKYGIPSIASNLPGPDEAVLHGKTGILVKDGDIDALAEAMYRLATNEKERNQLGTKAKRRVETEFRPAYQFKKLEALL